jgi:hypothetical protein
MNNKVKIFQNAEHIKDCYPAEARKMIKAGLAEKLILDGDFCIKLIENKEEKMSDEMIVDKMPRIIEIEENRIIINVKTEKNMDVFIKIRNDEKGDREIIHVDDGIVPGLVRKLEKAPIFHGRKTIDINGKEEHNKYFCNDMVLYGEKLFKVEEVTGKHYDGFYYKITTPEPLTLVVPERLLEIYHVSNIYSEKSKFKLFDKVEFTFNKFTGEKRNGVVFYGYGDEEVNIWNEEEMTEYAVPYENVFHILTTKKTP